MSLFKQRQPLSRRRVFKSAAALSVAVTSARPALAFVSGIALRKPTLNLAAVQACISSPDRVPSAEARAANLETMLSLLDKVQTYGGHKDICLFPVIPLPGDALPVLVQAARRYNSMLVYGSEGQSLSGPALRLTTIVAATGEVCVEHARLDQAAVLTLRSRNGTYRAVACAAESWYPGQAGLTTAIHSPDGRTIVTTHSRAEQAIAAVLHVGDGAAAATV